MKGFFQFLAARQIVVVIALSVLVALVMTVISMYMYKMDDVSRLDVSLPNREQVRPTETGGTNDDVETFSASGAVTAETLDKFQSMFDTRRKTLDSLGAYDGNVLDFESLRITTNE
jgi:LPS O-antigen subunit length determinant protein (WzzB/FepE family)